VLYNNFRDLAETEAKYPIDECSGRAFFQADCMLQMARGQMACHRLAIAACVIFFYSILVSYCFSLIDLFWLCNSKNSG
jgi:hypothetical protein